MPRLCRMPMLIAMTRLARTSSRWGARAEEGAITPLDHQRAADTNELLASLACAPGMAAPGSVAVELFGMDVVFGDAGHLEHVLHGQRHSGRAREVIDRLVKGRHVLFQQRAVDHAAFATPCASRLLDLGHGGDEAV